MAGTERACSGVHVQFVVFVWSVAHKDLNRQKILIDQFSENNVSELGLCGGIVTRKLIQTAVLPSGCKLRNQTEDPW